MQDKYIQRNQTYISVDDYIAKYGRENVIEGFNRAKAINDLFLSLEEGKFLGLDIIGVSDLSPEDTKLSAKVKDNDFFREL